MSERSFVIGGAGFIGSHLCELLAARGDVTVYDDLSVGADAFLAGARAVAAAHGHGLALVRGDALDLDALAGALQGHDRVVHLSANPEARWGLTRTGLDLQQGTVATWNALEATRRAGVPRFLFSSSGTVYGDTGAPRAELDLGHLPISLYGASKLAGEALISAFSACFDLGATIVRFGNVVGPRGTHGAALDFLNKLKATGGRELEVLGDGRQEKPYLHVSDCVEGLLFAADRGERPLGVYNLAPPDTTSVLRIAELCVKHSPWPSAPIRLAGGDRGWPGDVPRSRMRPDKLAALGFRVRLTSDQAVERAVRELAREVFPDATAASDA